MSMNDTILAIVENTIKTRKLDPETLRDNLNAYSRHNQSAAALTTETAYNFKASLVRAMIYSIWTSLNEGSKTSLGLERLLQILQKVSYFHPHQQLSDEDIAQYECLLRLLSDASQDFKHTEFFEYSSIATTNIGITATFTAETLQLLLGEFKTNDFVLELNCYGHLVGCLRQDNSYALYFPQAGFVLCDDFSALWDAVSDEFSSHMMLTTGKTKIALEKQFDTHGISLSIKGRILLDNQSENLSFNTVGLLQKYHVAPDLANASGYCPALILAAYTACNESFDYFISDYGDDISALVFDDYTPLYLACLNGNAHQVSSWINAFADNTQVYTALNARGHSPLSISCDKGYDSIVRLLLDAGADIYATRADSMSCFHQVCAAGNTAIAQLFIDAGIAINMVNKEGSTALYIASQQGHAVTVQTLLAAGADINIARDNGMSPLYVACQNAHEEVTRVLLNAAPNLNQTKNDGMTPLFIACQNGRHAVAALVANALSQNKQSLDVTIDGDIGPFFIACQNGHLAIVKLLLDLQMVEDLMQRRIAATGENAFFAAVRAGRAPVVKYLLKTLGAKRCGLDQSRNDGLTPFSMALFKKHKVMITAMVRVKMHDTQEPYDILKAYETLAVSYYLGGEFELADNLTRQYHTMVTTLEAKGIVLAELKQVSQWQGYLSQFTLDVYMDQLAVKSSLLKKIAATLPTI